MTSPPPPRFTIPVHPLNAGKPKRTFDVTVSERNRVALVPPTDVYVCDLDDDAVGKLQEALKECLRWTRERS